MFYKVIKNDKIIDVLDKLIFLKYQPKHKVMVLCEESDAQAILSSDKNHIWHEVSLYNIPISGYDTVRVEEIDEFEYRKLKIFNGKSPEEIVDAYTLSLIEGGII